MTKRYAATLVAGVAGLATLLTGCGGSEPSKTTGTTANSSGKSTPSTATVAKALPATVDVNNPAELASALNTIGIETPATEPIGTDRAGGAEGSAFPTWPAGDVRKDGLSTYRIDTFDTYEDNGTLKFMKGGKVLFEAPFKPTKDKTQSAIPASVLSAVKLGDTITWGIYFTGKQKPLTVSFTVIDKPAVKKAEAKLESDTAAGVVRELARGQILKNYRFYSEAVAVYSGVVDSDARITSAYTQIAECLHSLKLKNTPLFDIAKSRMPNGVAGRLRVSVGTGGGVAGVASGSGVTNNGPGPHPMGTAPAGSAPSAPSSPTAPATSPDDAPVAGTPNAPVGPPNPNAPGGLPTSGPGTGDPSGLPTAGPGTPGLPSDPSVPSHPTPPGPDHPTPPGPNHPTPPGPNHPAVPTPPHPVPGVPGTPPAPGTPGTPGAPDGSGPVPFDPNAPPGGGGVLPETPPPGGGGVQPENPPPGGGGVQPTPDPTPVDPANPH